MSKLIDLRYDGKMWNLSHSGKVNRDRNPFKTDELIEIYLPMNVKSGDVVSGQYKLTVRGTISLGSLLQMITSSYREHSGGSISYVVNGLVHVYGLEKIGINEYKLLLVR